MSGNPVRPEFLHTEVPNLQGARKVLIFGGSQGVHAINMAMVEAAPHLARTSNRPSITHQTGERDLAMVRDGYAAAGLDARVEPFIQNMAEEMTGANLIVSRAGSTTLAEIAACGRASILIPLPTATDDHQRKNAQALAASRRRGSAGSTRPDRRHTRHPHRPPGGRWAERWAMAEKVRTFAKPEAAATIVDRVLQLAKRA